MSKSYSSYFSWAYFFYGIGLAFLIVGLYFRNGRLNLYPSERFIEEEKITFGLTRLLDLANPPFYELNIFYSCLAIALSIFFIVSLQKHKRENDRFFNYLNGFIFLFSLIPLLTLAFNYEITDLVSTEEKPYSFRILSFLDDSLATSYRVKIKLNTLGFRMVLYSFILTFLLIFSLTIRALKYSKASNSDYLIDSP